MNNFIHLLYGAFNEQSKVRENHVSLVNPTLQDSGNKVSQNISDLLIHMFDALFRNNFVFFFLPPTSAYWKHVF